jgi:hypothetical protein
LYSSSSIIRMIKSRAMRWAGHGERMGRRGTRIGYRWHSQRERDHSVDRDVGSSMIKMGFWRDRMEWCGLDWSGSEYGQVVSSC